MRCLTCNIWLGSTAWNFALMMFRQQSFAWDFLPGACCFGVVLTGELLKETEEEGFTFVTQNVTHTIR